MQKLFAIVALSLVFCLFQSLFFCLLAIPFLLIKRTKKIGVWLLGCSMIVPAKAIQRACNGCGRCDYCSVWNCAAHLASGKERFFSHLCLFGQKKK